jgi:hypothetical protein
MWDTLNMTCSSLLHELITLNITLDANVNILLQTMPNNMVEGRQDLYTTLQKQYFYFSYIQYMRLFLKLCLSL